MGSPHADRARRAHLDPRRGKGKGEVREASSFDRCSAKEATWLFIRHVADLQEKEREERATMRQGNATAETLSQVVHAVFQMVRTRGGEHRERWLQSVRACHLPERHRVANGREQRARCRPEWCDAVSPHWTGRRTRDEDRAHQAHEGWACWMSSASPTCLTSSFMVHTTRGPHLSRHASPADLLGFRREPRFLLRSLCRERIEEGREELKCGHLLFQRCPLTVEEYPLVMEMSSRAATSSSRSWKALEVVSDTRMSDRSSSLGTLIVLPLRVLPLPHHVLFLESRTSGERYFLSFVTQRSRDLSAVPHHARELHQTRGRAPCAIVPAPHAPVSRRSSRRMGSSPHARVVWLSRSRSRVLAWRDASSLSDAWQHG